MFCSLADVGQIVSRNIMLFLIIIIIIMIIIIIIIIIIIRTFC